LLPGRGTVTERYLSRRRERALPPQVVPAALEAIRAEFRVATRERFGLPDEEEVELEVVSGESWVAFAYYEGGLHTRVAINGDFLCPPEDLIECVAHEGYPGHHTEHATKEARLTRGRGWGEHAIWLVGTQHAVIAEGIATTALDMLGQDALRACARTFAGFGVDYDPVLEQELRLATTPLTSVLDNMAAIVHEQGGTVDDAAAFGERWLLRTPDEVARVASGLTDPAWRAYMVVYAAGRELVSAWAGGDERRWWRLHTEPLTVAELQKEVAAPAAR
jgi:hypothetical protein